MADKETGHENEMSFESALENYLNPDFGDLEEGSITKGEIVRVDDDNVLVDVNFKSEGQIPASEFRDAAGNMTVSVGDRVDVYVVRKNEMEGTITLSFEKAKRMQVFDQLEDVQENNRVIKGHIVRRIKGGYTVDLGGVEGLVPVREISWDKVVNPGDFVREGDLVTVKVIGIDWARERISLSIRQTQTKPLKPRSPEEIAAEAEAQDVRDWMSANAGKTDSFSNIGSAFAGVKLD